MITPKIRLAIIPALLFACLSCNNNASPEATKITDSVFLDSSTESIEIASPAVSTAIVDTIKNALINDLVKKDLDILTENDRRFIYTETDLNQDGKNEIFVGMQGSYFCGNAGCTVYLLTNEGKRINTFTIVDGPIAITADRTKGWNDLIIPSRGVNYLVKYNGKAYPANPSVQPKFTGTVTDDMQKVLPGNSTEYSF